MDAILSFLEWIAEIFIQLYELLLNIGNWISGIFEFVAYALTIPAAGYDLIDKLSDYFPLYLWTPILALLYAVMVFRILKIMLSGGE